MLVIIVGGGKTGSHLATQLIEQGHAVKVIEARPDVIERLQQELSEQVIIVGDGSSPATLEAAGIDQANVLAAVTGEDETNLVITSLGRFEYHVPRIIARVNNPKNAWLFTEEMGVDVALSQTDILAKLIVEEMSLGDMMTVFKIRRGRYSVVEEKVPEGAMGIGIPLKNMGLEEQCVIAAIIRDGKMALPKGESTFKAGDEIIAVASPEGAKKLSALLAHPVYPVRQPRKKSGSS